MYLRVQEVLDVSVLTTQTCMSISMTAFSLKTAFEKKMCKLSTHFPVMF